MAGPVERVVEQRLESATQVDGPSPSLMKVIGPFWALAVRPLLPRGVRGLGAAARRSRALLVSVHAGAALTIDAWVFVYGWHRHFGDERILHGTAHDVLMTAPLLGDYFKASGVIPASREGVTAALDCGHDVIVWPGGEQDSMRNWRRRDEVVLAGRRGFVKQAINSGVPIVPVATSGGSDSVFVLSEGRWIAGALDKLGGIAGKLRAATLPIVAGVPFGITPRGPAGAHPAADQAALRDPRPRRDRPGPRPRGRRRLRQRQVPRGRAGAAGRRQPPRRAPPLPDPRLGSAACPPSARPTASRWPPAHPAVRWWGRLEVVGARAPAGGRPAAAGRQPRLLLGPGGGRHRRPAAPPDQGAGQVLAVEAGPREDPRRHGADPDRPRQEGRGRRSRARSRSCAPAPASASSRRGRARSAASCAPAPASAASPPPCPRPRSAAWSSPAPQHPALPARPPARPGPLLHPRGRRPEARRGPRRAARPAARGDPPRGATRPGRA